MEISVLLFVLLAASDGTSGFYPDFGELTITQYQIRFVPYDTINPEEFPIDNYNTENLKRWNTLIQPSKQQINYTVSLQNLLTTLEGFKNSNCLLVIESDRGVDIEQTSGIPYIINTLDLVLYHRKYQKMGAVEDWNTMLLPRKIAITHENFSELVLESYKYHHCPISQFYSPLMQEKTEFAFCVELDREIFLFNIRPWQCEIQENLLMSSRLIKAWNLPAIFHYKNELKFSLMPSSQPKNSYYF